MQAHQPNGMFRNLDIHPRWIEGHDSFWYKRETEGGYEFVLVDAAKGSRSLAFNHGKLANRLARATDKEVDASLFSLV